MGEEKPEIEPAPPNPNLSLAMDVHNYLMDRFGKYKKSDWEPNQENIVVMEDDVFDKLMVLKMSGLNIPDKKRAEHAKTILGYANFSDNKLYMRNTFESTQEQKLTMAHEMLHLWFQRQSLDEADINSYGVNETFVDTLALEGLNYFNLPKEERAEMTDGSINNAALIKGVMEKLGEVGWSNLFQTCQTGKEQGIRNLMTEKFGEQPPEDIKIIDEELPRIYNEALWGRFKELALMIYYVKRDPLFQPNNPDTVGYQQILVIEWSGLDNKYLAELD